MIYLVTELSPTKPGLNIYHNDPYSKGFKLRLDVWHFVFYVMVRYSVNARRWFFGWYTSDKRLDPTKLCWYISRLDKKTKEFVIITKYTHKTKRSEYVMMDHCNPVIKNVVYMSDLNNIAKEHYESTISKSG
jgi:hypothetical protein